MAFLGISISPEIGKLLSSLNVPGKKEDVSELHITLLYFGENWKISEISKAVEPLYKVISKINPFPITINSVTCFPAREDQPVPIIASVESKELHNLNKKLKKALDKKEIKYSKLHKEFVPHVTLSYNKKEIDEFSIKPIKYTVSEIVLWAGNKGTDKLSMTFPLKKLEKNASIIYKSEIFDHFTKIL